MTTDMSRDCCRAGGDQIAEMLLLLLLDTGAAGTTGAEAVVGRVADVFELPTDGGELLYGDPGLELEGGGDLLPPLDDVPALGLGFGVSGPFCCCRHFARRFLNQTCEIKIELIYPEA